MDVPVQSCEAYRIPSGIGHTIAHDTSNIGTVAATYGTADGRAGGAIS